MALAHNVVTNRFVNFRVDFEEVFYRRPDSTYVVPPEPETKAESDENDDEEEEEEEEDTDGPRSRASSEHGSSS